MKAFNHNILLASKSPRRSSLLGSAGFKFEVKTLEVEESYPDDLPVQEVPEFLAIKKAVGNKSLLAEGQIMITADTVVIFKNEIFGKPVDAMHAYKMLGRLSGQSHTVITGVCIYSVDKQVSFSDTAYVSLADLSEAEIKYYVDTYQPFDKAGSYAIQEWIGICKIDKIEGSYSNIMGLPMQKLYPALTKF
jgi:septum formation protein